MDSLIGWISDTLPYVILSCVWATVVMLFRRRYKERHDRENKLGVRQFEVATQTILTQQQLIESLTQHNNRLRNRIVSLENGEIGEPLLDFDPEPVDVDGDVQLSRPFSTTSMVSVGVNERVSIPYIAGGGGAGGAGGSASFSAGAAGGPNYGGGGGGGATGPMFHSTFAAFAEIARVPKPEPEPEAKPILWPKRDGRRKIRI